jgi:hypothetical protein
MFTQKHIRAVLAFQSIRWEAAPAKYQPRILSGAGCRSRTRDLLITNQLLYQLS